MQYTEVYPHNALQDVLWFMLRHGNPSDDHTVVRQSAVASERVGDGTTASRADQTSTGRPTSSRVKVETRLDVSLAETKRELAQTKEELTGEEKKEDASSLTETDHREEKDQKENRSSNTVAPVDDFTVHPTHYTLTQENDMKDNFVKIIHTATIAVVIASNKQGEKLES